MPDQLPFEAAMETVSRFIGAGAAPGAAAAVGRKGTVSRSGAFGTLEPGGAKANRKTLFDLASLTKVTATLPVLMKLVELGKLDLSMPVSRFIHGFGVPDKSHIHLFDLAVHSSGLRAHMGFYEQSCHSVDEAVLMIGREPLVYETGSKVEYSDLGFIILGKVVELAGDNRLDALAKKYIFDPLGMDNTVFRPDVLDNIARTEVNPGTDKYICGVVHDENARAFGGVSGHAGLFSTVGDMARYAKMLLGGGGLDGVQILSAQSVEAMSRNHTPHLNLSRGIGWQVNSPPSFGMELGTGSAGDLMSRSAFGHTGFTGTSVWIDSENDVFAILLTNRVCPTRENTMILEMRKAFHNSIFCV